MDNKQNILEEFLTYQQKVIGTFTEISEFATKKLIETFQLEYNDENFSSFKESTTNDIQNSSLEIENDDTEFSIFDYYSLTIREDVIISYKGPVTDVILSEISRDIRHKFAEDRKTSKRLFSVFIELAQNILYYSSEKINFADRRDSIGTILITKQKEGHTFSCGNLVEVHFVEQLLESCEKINSLDRDGLREYKREMRMAPQSERSKGAGIGLIQVALTSRSPLKVEARPVNDEYSFFSLTVKIMP